MRATPEGQRLADFLNTTDHRRPDRREPPFAPDDELASPAGLTAWLGTRWSAPLPAASAADLEHARRLRAGLRDAVEEPGGQPPTDAFQVEAGSFPLLVELDDQGTPRLAPASGGVEGALAGILIDAVRLAQAGQWNRLKRCAADDCRWIFFDRSRPGTGRWCSQAACGNRDKTRRYRNRRTGGRGTRRTVRQEGTSLGEPVSPRF